MHAVAATPDAYLAALSNAAALLDWPLPRERDEATCHEAARALDALLVRVARGRGALDLAVGEGLEAMATGGRVLELGCSGIGDYARERLGIAASTAQKMVRFARRLRDRPLLRAAVRKGEVTPRAAEAVLPKACGDDEAAWVERARHQTVRALKAAVEGGAEEDDEEWHRTRARLSSEQRTVVDKGMDLARKALCATAPKWELVGAMAEEYLGANPHPEGIAADSFPAAIAQHFIDVWETALAVRGTLHRRVLERDRFLCQVPGCSRAADHAHHIEYRSRGGSDDLTNLTSLCAVHHLQGVHMGRIRVSGAAPDGLWWEVRTPEGWVPMG